jgi:6-phosphogluconolactonase (cycloisomerase 2 family)
LKPILSNLTDVGISPSAVSVIDTTKLINSTTASSSNLIQLLTFPDYSARVVPDRQEASHAHQIVWDPTGKFLLIPDLGADLIRIYRMDDSSKFHEMTSLTVVPGTGPRHVAWWSLDSKNASNGSPLFLLVNGELSGIVSVYRATYLEEKSGLTFTLVSQARAIGESTTTQYFPAEIAVSVSYAANSLRNVQLISLAGQSIRDGFQPTRQLLQSHSQRQWGRNSV